MSHKTARRENRELHAIERWHECGGYLVGCHARHDDDPRVFHDENGIGIAADQRDEGDARGGLVGSAADVLRDYPLHTWIVTTSNGAYWQRHRVLAASEAQAATVAESDAGANSPATLREESRAATAIGVTAAGRYAACRVEWEAIADADADADPFDPWHVEFLDAGAEG